MCMLFVRVDGEIKSCDLVVFWAFDHWMKLGCRASGGWMYSDSLVLALVLIVLYGSGIEWIVLL